MIALDRIEQVGGRQHLERPARADLAGKRIAAHPPVNAEREAFIETRAQEVDLPVRFTVVYQDLERDADIGTQYAKRVAGPPGFLTAGRRGSWAGGTDGRGVAVMCRFDG